MCSKKILWGSCNGSSLDIWPELAYRVKGGQLSCLHEARGAPEVPLKGIRPMRWNGRMDNPRWGGDRTCLGEGVGWGGIKAPPLHAQASTSPPPLAFHDPILLMSSSSTPWKIFSYNPGLRNLRAWHGIVMPPCRLRKNWGSKFGLRWMKGWWWNELPFRPHPLLSWGHSPQVK